MGQEKGIIRSYDTTGPQTTKFYKGFVRFVVRCACGSGSDLLTRKRAASSSILGISSAMRKGFDTTSSMPAARSVAICSVLAFAVTAHIGTWLFSNPVFSHSRMRLVQCRPSMTGISLSMRTTPRSTASAAWPFQYRDSLSFSSASPPWFATYVVMPLF